MMHLNETQAQALASFIGRVRPDWDHPGIMAALKKAAPLGTPADIGTALCRLAANPDVRTPAILAEPGTHWRDTTVASRLAPVMCPDHPAHLARDCRECRSLADAADHARGAAAVRSAMKPRPRANPRRDPEPTDLSATRARADKEATT